MANIKIYEVFGFCFGISSVIQGGVKLVGEEDMVLNSYSDIGEEVINGAK